MNGIGILVRRLAADQRGATAIEYCLIASIVSITIVAGATQIGTSVLGMFNQIANGFK